MKCVNMDCKRHDSGEDNGCTYLSITSCPNPVLGPCPDARFMCGVMRCFHPLTGPLFCVGLDSYQCPKNATGSTSDSEPVPAENASSANVADDRCNHDPQSRHYDAGGIEVIEVIRAKLTREQYMGYLLGNIIKYACRFNFKGQAERDADKMAFYSMWLDEAMEE